MWQDPPAACLGACNNMNQRPGYARTCFENAKSVSVGIEFDSWCWERKGICEGLKTVARTSLMVGSR